MKILIRSRPTKQGVRALVLDCNGDRPEIVPPDTSYDFTLRVEVRQFNALLGEGYANGLYTHKQKEYVMLVIETRKIGEKVEAVMGAESALVDYISNQTADWNHNNAATVLANRLGFVVEATAELVEGDRVHSVVRKVG
jgi:hypothetical protein